MSNESVPLGISIDPTENHFVYQQFYDFIEQIDPILFNILTHIPVLSDEGSTLQEFCRSK